MAVAGGHAASRCDGAAGGRAHVCDQQVLEALQYSGDAVGELSGEEGGELCLPWVGGFVRWVWFIAENHLNVIDLNFCARATGLFPLSECRHWSRVS